jgi:hypothetical protein
VNNVTELFPSTSWTSSISSKAGWILILLIGSSRGLHAKPPKILGGQFRKKKKKLKKPPHEVTYDPRWKLKKRIKLPTFAITHTAKPPRILGGQSRNKKKN